MKGAVSRVITGFLSHKPKENQNEMMRCITDLIHASNSPNKPTIQIFPIDRMFVERYITKTYRALVSNGYSKEWAISKAFEWEKMGHPRKVIPDILKYVNIQLQSHPKAWYF